MISLLDVNMLIALAWPSHVHHADAQYWFSEHAAAGWATCPLTQTGFVRISSNPKIIPDAVTPREALAMLAEIIKLRGHHFWQDHIGLLDGAIPTNTLMGHRQVTDAYLLGLAIHRHGQLVTFDSGIADLLPIKSPQRNSLHIVNNRLRTP